MLFNVLNRKSGNLFLRLATCLAVVAGVGLWAGLAEPVSAASSRTPIQLDISVKPRVTWTQNAVEYRVVLSRELNNKPRTFGLRETKIQYKIIDQQDRCDATASWAKDLPRRHRNIILDKWKTKPNYLFLLRKTAIKYLGYKFCFRISKAPSDGQFYRDGYADILVEKWWTGLESGGVCPSVYTWIKDATIMSGGQTTVYWQINNIRNPDSVRITARNHDYWFYDTSFAEPNIKKKYGNPHEVTSTYDAATNTITASRTVVGHLYPRANNLYVIKVHQAGMTGCPSAQDAVYMRVNFD